MTTNTPAPPAEIRHLSTTIIRPTTKTKTETESTQRIELNPWDLRLLPIHVNQKGLLFMKPKHEDCQSMIDHLKTSLSQTLNHFYPLAGRLGTTLHEEDNTTTVFINCNSAGAEFIHAAADITISDILNPTYVPRIVINSLFPLNGVINYDGRSQPLLSVQVTELLDGIFIGCSLNHAVCDGTSFFHFMNSWSEIARGSSKNLNQISRPPIFKRWFPNETTIPIRLPFANDDHFRETHIMPPLEKRFFHFSPENIAKLKSKANSDNGSDLNHQISSFQALIAHVWLAATRAKRLDLNEEVTYRLLMGNRSRLNPPLPQEYFGNSYNSGFAKVKVAKLLERGHRFGASLLNQVVNSHNDESIRSSWKSWVENPVLLFFNNLDSDTFVTDGSPRFNMYGNDFGWGRPIAVRNGCNNKVCGTITIYPGAIEGSIDIEACMGLETLKAMGEDAEFMEAVTISPPFQSNV